MLTDGFDKMDKTFAKVCQSTTSALCSMKVCSQRYLYAISCVAAGSCVNAYIFVFFVR